MNKKKYLLIVLMLITCLLILSACKKNPSIQQENGKCQIRLLDEIINTDNINISSEKLNNISVNDNKLTLIIQTKGESLAEYYLKQNKYNTIYEFASSDIGLEQIELLKKSQNEIKTTILENGIEGKFKFTYTTLFNGFSIEIDSKDIDRIKEISGIKNIYISKNYEIPNYLLTASNVKNAIGNHGIYSNNTQYLGEGMSIAIIDSGIDYNHSAFNNNLENISLSKEYISNIINYLSCNNNGIMYSAETQYYNSKIPFMFDYADNDGDAKPSDVAVWGYNGTHGTHVSGIVAGEDDKIQGVVPKAQIVPLKVFSDNDGRSSTIDILAALCDAAMLGVDAVNMSLGIPGGFAQEKYDDTKIINDVHNLLDKLGICVITAAGNSSNTASINKKGYLDSSNPDNGIISSPATYDSSIAVGSLNQTINSYFKFNNKSYIYTDVKNYINGEYVPYNFFDLILNGNDKLETEIVYINGTGDYSDYDGKNVKDKIVLVQRGGLTFTRKHEIAAELGAIGCIIYNNTDGKVAPYINPLKIPTCTLTQKEGEEIISSIADGKSIFIIEKKFAYYNMSSFSSWGCSPELNLKPDMIAPGENIYSSVHSAYTYGLPYATMSGTSMASPNLAGLTLSVMQFLKSENPSLTKKELQNLTYQIMMSTADIITNSDGVAYSPRQQGAGIPSLENAMNAKAYLKVLGSNKSKLELGDDKYRDGIYTLDFKLVNFSNENLQYCIETLVMTEKLLNGLIMNTPYLLKDYDTEIYINNQKSNKDNIDVSAQSEVSIKIIIKLNEDNKAYLNQFKNGIYVEGFIKLIGLNNESNLSLPYLAFYGDWTDAPIFDNSVFDSTDAFIYNTKIYSKINDEYYSLGEYSKYNLPKNYAMPNASIDKIAISGHENAYSMIYTIEMALLRSVGELNYYFMDVNSKMVYQQFYGFNIPKAYTNNGVTYFTTHDLSVMAINNAWANNQELNFIIEGILEYEGKNKIQSISFPIFIDSEAPTLVNAEIFKENNRTYIDMEIYDNHYLQDMMICSVNDDGEYCTVFDYAIPVYDWIKGQNNNIILDITDYIPELNNGKLAILFEDYACNKNTYYIADIESESESTENNTNAISKILSNNNSTEILVKYENNDSPILNDVNDTEFVVDNGVLNGYKGPSDVIIPSDLGITEIGKAFSSRKDITSVEIPEGVIIIRENAFSFCKNLKSVKLPNSLIRIESMAFLNARKLENINLQDTSINYVGNHAFYLANSIKELIFPDVDNLELGYAPMLYMESIERLIFKGNCPVVDVLLDICPNLKEVIFMKDFGGSQGNGWKNLFGSAKKLEKLEFHGNVGEIGKNDFNADFSGIGVKEIHFYGNVEGITGCNFSSCPNLEKVVFHGNVGKIAGNAFTNCKKLTQFSVSDDNKYMFIDKESGVMYNNEKTKMMAPPAWKYNGIFEIPNTITEIYSGMFSSGAIYVSYYTWILDDYEAYSYLRPDTGFEYVETLEKGLTGVIIPDSITNIPSFAFSGSVDLEFVKFNKINEIGERAFYNCRNLKTLKFNDNLTYIGDEAFSNCESLSELELGEKVLYLGYASLMNCKNIKSVSIPLVENIEYNTFMNCHNLENINLNSAISYIDDNAFTNCYKLNNFALPENVTYIGEGAFENCEKLSGEINLKNVDTLKASAFAGCKGIEQIIFGDMITNLDSYTFAYTAFDSINITKYIENIDFSTVFYGNNELKNVVIDEENPSYTVVDEVVYDLAMEILYYYPAMKADVEFNIPDSVTEIGAYAFANNKTIKSVKANYINLINRNAFEYTQIESFIVNSINTIDGYAFYNANNLHEVVIPNIFEIGEYGFAYTALKEFTINDSLIYIGRYAFAYCKNLSKIEFTENATQLDYPFIFFGSPINEIVINPKNQNYTMENGILYNKDKTVIYKALSADNKLVISEGIVKVSAFAFMNIANIESVEFPASMKAIGDKAFYGCNGLKELTFKSEKAPMLECMINENQYYYSNFVTEIGNENLKLTVNHVDNASYNNFIWTTYFAVHNIIAK